MQVSERGVISVERRASNGSVLLRHRGHRARRLA
jgi:hypothetical protein